MMVCSVGFFKTMKDFSTYVVDGFGILLKIEACGNVFYTKNKSTRKKIQKKERKIVVKTSRKH